MELTQKFIDNYSYLFEEKLINEILEVGTQRKINSEEIIIDINHYIVSIPLLLSGAIKIIREDLNGDELVLYYLEKGDTCAITLSCCMGQTKSKIRAIAETDVELLMLPKEKMSDWLSEYKSWQTFILQSYHNRVDELLNAIDTIAFLKMDDRLFKYLKDRAMVTHNDELTTTHREIADDLHTSRVVISRLLKKLENEKKIKIFRNSIKLLEI